MPRSSSSSRSGTSRAGPGLHLELDRGHGAIGRQVEDRLREAIRSGRLGDGAALPSTRVLAQDLGVSRRLVVDAYAQLTAEGWLVARQGAGTRVAETVARGASAAPAPVPAERLRYDFFPGTPDLAAFPRGAWLRALRAVLRDAPDSALHYPDPAGTAELRTALAAHLGRARGVLGGPEHVTVVAGVRQGLTLLGRVLVGAGVHTVAVERPSLPPHAESLRATGLDLAGVPVDGDGLDVDSLARSGAQAVVVTPAHQFPLGVALAPERRAALLAWAAAAPGRLIIEDDYDAEFRYDRRPVGALQALDPDRVAYLGSVSKSLAPGLRLGWVVAREPLRAALAHQKDLDDGGSPALDQLALARMLEHADYDRHIRLARRRHRARRDALAAALAVEVPDARLEGLAAGLHVIVRLAEPVPAGALSAAARRRGVGVYPLAAPQDDADALIMGYAGLPEPAIAEGVRRLAVALASVREQPV